jgi:hypothetical protein
MKVDMGMISVLGLALGCGTANNHETGKVPSAERAPDPTPPPAAPPPSAAKTQPEPAKALVGEAALSDWTGDAPGVRRKITLQDLPAPHATESLNNGPDTVDPKEGALPAWLVET